MNTAVQLVTINVLISTYFIEENAIGGHIDEIPSESDISDLNDGARNINDVASLECSICEFKCKNKIELCKHLKPHKIYACQKCDYKNKSLKGLNSHIKIHNEKGFECTKCKFKGTSVNTLNAHMNTHLRDEIRAASQRTKRDYSISPEIDKNSRQNKIQKL